MRDVVTAVNYYPAACSGVGMYCSKEIAFDSYVSDGSDVYDGIG